MSFTTWQLPVYTICYQYTHWHSIPFVWFIAL